MLGIDREKVKVRTRRASRVYRAKHPEKIRAANAQYYERHRARELARVKAYNLAHSTEKYAYKVAYEAANPEVKRAMDARRYARKRGVTLNDFTAAQWQLLQEVFDHRCAYCGERHKGKLTRDHITPAGPEGPNTLHNIVPACRKCNSQKNAGPVLCPVQPLLL